MKIPVAKRLFPSFMKKWAALTWTDGYKVRRYRGLLWLLNWRNFVDRQIGLLGGYEEEQMAFLLGEMAKGCDCFVDIGANFGLYTLQVINSGYAKEAHAFEPDPRNYCQLGGNLYLNKMAEKVVVHRIALSDKAGELKFDLAPEKSTGTTRVSNLAGAGTAESETVIFNAVPLDNVLTFEKKKIFFKIDVEGHEVSVLKGAQKLLTENDCFLQIEAFTNSGQSVADFLAPLGYKHTHSIASDHYFAKFS